MGEGNMQSVSFQDQPAVADDDEATERPTTVAEKEQQRLAPQTPVEGTPQRGPSSKHNQEWEVGNFGILRCNWGTRGERESQILKSPAKVQVVIALQDPQSRNDWDADDWDADDWSWPQSRNWRW